MSDLRSDVACVSAFDSVYLLEHLAFRFIVTNVQRVTHYNCQVDTKVRTGGQFSLILRAY